MALLVLSQTPPPPLSRASAEGSLRLAPSGFDPLAAWFALLGQDPVARWRSLAPLALTASGGVQAEDETVYLLTPVSAAEGHISAELDLGPGTQSDLLDSLEESLEDEAATLRPGPWGPTLVLAEEIPGPPAVQRDALGGRALHDLPAGPPELLRRVVAASAEACAALGRPHGATHLFPHSPAAAGGFQPIREAWLGLPSAAFVGGPLARAMAGLLGGTHWPAAPGRVLEIAREREQTPDLVVAVEPSPLDPLEFAGLERLALAGPPRPGSAGIEVELRVRGHQRPELSSSDPLRAWALGT